MHPGPPSDTSTPPLMSRHCARSRGLGTQTEQGDIVSVFKNLTAQLGEQMAISITKKEENPVQWRHGLLRKYEAGDKFHLDHRGQPPEGEACGLTAAGWKEPDPQQGSSSNRSRRSGARPPWTDRTARPRAEATPPTSCPEAGTSQLSPGCLITCHSDRQANPPAPKGTPAS